jgi:carboxymethylenebutenolidase
MDLLRTEEKFPCADGFQMSAYLTRPAGSSPVPGLLFIYEAFGMNSEMHRLADELAAAGYAALIPDLFTRGSWFSCVKKLISDLKAESGQGVDDLLQARRWLAERHFVDSQRIAVMGPCLGGAFALLLGKTGLFRVAAPFYGNVRQKLDGICPVVASYGAKDRQLVKDAARLEKELPTLGIPYDMKIYPQAGHGFMNRRTNPVVDFVGRATGAVAY